MRSDQFSTAEVIPDGTTIGSDSISRDGPFCQASASAVPEIGAVGVPGPAGSNVPVLIVQLPFWLFTVQPVKLDVPAAGVAVSVTDAL